MKNSKSGEQKTLQKSVRFNARHRCLVFRELRVDIAEPRPCGPCRINLQRRSFAVHVIMAVSPIVGFKEDEEYSFTLLSSPLRAAAVFF